MNDQETPRGVGDNRPPLWDEKKLTLLTARAEKLTDIIENWVRREIEDEDAAENLRDVLGMVVKLKADAETQRTADKKQHLDAGKAVDEAFHAIGRRLDHLTGPPKQKLGAWLDIKEAKRKEAEAEAARKEAEARAEAARLEALAAQTGSIRAEEAAEDAAAVVKTAEKSHRLITKAVVRVRSASGGTRAASVRGRNVATIIDINQAFLHFRDHPDVATVLTKLANAEIRAKDGPATVPGFKISEDRTVV